MTAYTSLETAGPRTYPVSGVGMDGRTEHVLRAEFTVGTALTTADTILMQYLPPRARVTGGFIKTTGQIDSNGSPTVTVNAGTTASPQLFFAASAAVGRSASATADNNMAPTGRDFLTTAKTPVYITLQANPATGATGATIILYIIYTVEQPA